MASIPNPLRQQVRERAKCRCEYCLLPEDYSIYHHEIDHIIAVKHGGQTVTKNLALACLSCNRYKGSDFATINPETEEITPLFHPRRQVWTDHFKLNRPTGRIEGITPIGQATVQLLQFNTSVRMLERQVLIQQNVLFVES